MLVTGILVCALVAITCSMTAAACAQGFFGSRCQYKCHCTTIYPCPSCDPCDAKGECQVGAVCEPGWFGPACQYVDMAYDSAVVKFANWKTSLDLTDGDDNTCLKTPTIEFVNLTWTEPFLFTWLRIHVKNPDQIHRITVRFRSSNLPPLDCSNPRNATVDSSSLDIYCDIDVPIRTIILEGAGVKELCSVYVSGGRNIALLENATQSSDFGKAYAEKAVDGDKYADFNRRGSCSHTAVNKDSATWNVTFSLPQLINRFWLYNRGDCCQERLHGFILTASSVAGKNFSYQEVTNEMTVYKVTFPTNNTPVQHVGIEARHRDSTFGVLLTLCEVEIYGDTDCTDGRYGRDCENTCNCAGECFVSTGGCPAGCPAGYHGENCRSHCPHGYFGVNCQEDCSKNCAGDGGCDATDGRCSHGCKAGYRNPTCSNTSASSSQSDSSLAGPAIGAVAAVMLLVITVTIGFICWRRRKYSTPEPSLVISTEGVGNSDHGNTNRFSEIMMTKLTKSNKPEVGETPSGNTCTLPGPTKVDYYNYTPAYRDSNSTQIAVRDLDVYMSTHDKRFFQQQFASIPANEEATMAVGLSSANKNKNRYKNVCAYDHSRVHLLASKNKKHGDYINASYVEGYKREESFIASQGPTKAILGDFVQMLWEQQVDKVVMLTNLLEEGKQKCERYWPEDGEIKLGEITVKLATTQVFADYTIRILHLSMKGEQAQTVTHFHFTSWPDKDVPTGPWGLVDFEQRVASYPTNKPIVVHCSAGVGRTGTFIALRNVIRQAEDTGYVDVFTTVKMLRRSRVNMVQTADQYEFLHKSAQVAILCMGTTVTSRDVQDRIQILSLTAESGHTNMEKEFQAVSNICNMDDGHELNNGDTQDNPYTVYENSRTVANISKNRFGNILPKEYYRVLLQAGVSGTGDYINAVFVPSFTKQKQQMLTQFPLPTTVTDFWRLVTQYNVTLIVAFETDLSLSDKVEGEIYLTHLKCTKANLEPGNLLSIVNHVRSLAPVGEGRTVYMCRNGADDCGLACILSLLLDRMDSDQRLTIPLVVGAIKAIRPQVIPTLTQYQLLYDVLSMYIDSINVYSNF